MEEKFTLLILTEKDGVALIISEKVYLGAEYYKL